MSNVTGEAAAIGWEETSFDPPLLDAGNAALRWVGPFISLGIFGAVLFQLRHLQIAAIPAMVPHSPLFWLAFAAYYLATPAFDFLIFRRLWGLPAAGFGALTRKFVGNEILMGYIGEVHFYSWARSRLKMVTAPFGAIKDVAIPTEWSASRPEVTRHAPRLGEHQVEVLGGVQDAVLHAGRNRAALLRVGHGVGACSQALLRGPHSPQKLGGSALSPAERADLVAFLLSL